MPNTSARKEMEACQTPETYYLKITVLTHCYVFPKVLKLNKNQILMCSRKKHAVNSKDWYSSCLLHLFLFFTLKMKAKYFQVVSTILRRSRKYRQTFYSTE